MANFDNIIQEINTNLPDNTSQAITAAKLRTTLIDLTNTIEDQQSDFETEAMADIQPAIDLVENGVKFETNQLITDTKIVNNLTSGGINDILSAEMGKQIANNLSSIEPITEYTTISPQAGGVYTYINSRQPGDQVEQISESVSNNFTLLKYSIDASKTYYGTLKPQINMNLSGIYVYFWADADGLLIQKEKTLSSTYANNTWENYVLTPPEGAVTLYVQARTSYVSRYSVSDIQFINVQEVKDEITNLETNMVEKSDLTMITPLLPIDEFFKYINPNTINTEGINIEENINASERYVVYKFEVKPETTYNVTGKNVNSSLSGVYAYYWADENGGYISRFKNMSTSNEEWSLEYLSPVNAHYLYVMIPRVNNSTNPIIDNIWKWAVNEISVSSPQEMYENQFKGKTEITFLSIGNSYSEDIFGYVPYIMRQINPNIKMTGLMLMQSANTSATPPQGVPESHYRNFVNNSKVYYYSRWYSNSLAWRQSGAYNVSIKDALRGREITYDSNNQEVVGEYIDPENRPKIDVILLQAAAASTRANFKFTNALIRKITDYLGYPVQIGLFSAAYRSSTSNNGNAYSYDYILYNSLGNLEFAKRFVKSTPGSFLISGCSAIQNARSIDALKVTGSYMNQANNTSGFGYLSSYDGNHISDGIGRQTYAYAVVGTLLKNMGFNWKGIMGDKTVMDGEYVKWISCPHPHDGTTPTTGVINTYGTDATTIALSRFCAAMAIEHPLYIYDLNNYNTEIDLNDTENLNVETMEFKRFIRISKTLAEGVTSSNTSYYVMEGDDFDTTLTGTITSVKVLIGDLDITRLSYDSETQTIHIGNVSETVTITVE